MTAKLVAEEGILKDLVLSFDEGDQWVIGRDPDACQLIVEDPAASRKHAEARRTSEGIILENLSHTNPLQINDEPLTAPHLLQMGDMVKIGDTSFRFYVEDEAKIFEENTVKNIPEGNQVPFPTQSPEKTDEVDVQPTQEEKEHVSIFEEEPPAEQPELAQINLDLMETGRWLLKVVAGPNNGAEFSMQTGKSYVIGTDPNSCDIVFYDNSVSRQHAKITISNDDTITIEDLKSRNGTRVDGELLTAPQILPFNILVSIGTTSFVVYDREGEMQTIISPLLPSIVKVLQKEEAPAKASVQSELEGSRAGFAAEDLERIGAPPVPAKTSHTAGALILTGILIGLFAIAGIAIQTLFVQEPVVVEQQIDTEKALTDALTPFTGVKYSFNKTTGRVLLVGHVLTPSDKTQLLSNLQGMKFIRDIDDSGVVVDEYVWSEANQILSKNPGWKGVTIHVPSPGKYVVSGYLQTNEQAQQVWDYLSRNFPYLDLLENKIVIEEKIVGDVTTALHRQGIGSVRAQMSNGELTLTGVYPSDKKDAFENQLTQFQEIPGVRNLRNLVNEQAPNAAIVNISNKYLVTGVSRTGGTLSVIINGRILMQGDVLDGMRIISVTPSTVMLEKDGVKYQIDINR